MTSTRLSIALIAAFIAFFIEPIAAQQAVLRIEVRASSKPVKNADVVVNGETHRTDDAGASVVKVAPGRIDIVIVAPGYTPASVSVDVAANQEQPVVVELTRDPSVEEHVTVSATRTDRGLEDQPMRVEVVDREEIEEKAMMTPGDVVMLLNETGGMRVQATSPSLGAASVRIQGMRGRYTRFLSDGLPLFGDQVSLGLMQIPPLDLGRVEVIKGVASSLYGAGAMSGVVNLVSRRPGSTPEFQMLANRSSRGATDLGAWYARPLAGEWSLAVLGSANGQSRSDVDGDGWADLPRYARAVVRPRLFWDDGAGRTLFATVGGTWEDRTGGTLPGVALPAAGTDREALDTRKVDGGASFQALSANGIVWSARGSWAAQHQDHQFGDVRERDDRATGFAEITMRRAIGRHTIVGGAAVEHDRFTPQDVPRFAYTFTTPGVFAQDDMDLARWLSVSASVRFDHHSEYGPFVSPRISGLVRRGSWSSRLSYGTGFYAPTALTEETEAAGLTHLVIDTPLKAERGASTSFDLTRTAGALSTTITFFHARIADPVVAERNDKFVLRNLESATTNAGMEALAVWKSENLSIVANYAYVRSREGVGADRAEVPLTPRHSFGIDGAWESEGGWRIGLEWYHTGAQRLEANPYRTESEPYSVFGVLASRRIRGALLFINGENLTDVRQSRWDPLLRPSRGSDGRWTVDAWAPLEGRVINGGIRVTF